MPASAPALISAATQRLPETSTAVAMARRVDGVVDVIDHLHHAGE